MNCVVLGQREIFESLRVEFFAERTGLKLSVMECQSCGSSKVIGTEGPSCRRASLPTWVGIGVGWIRAVLHAQLDNEFLGSLLQFVRGWEFQEERNSTVIHGNDDLPLRELAYLVQH